MMPLMGPVTNTPIKISFIQSNEFHAFLIQLRSLVAPYRRVGELLNMGCKACGSVDLYVLPPFELVSAITLN